MGRRMGRCMCEACSALCRKKRVSVPHLCCSPLKLRWAFPITCSVLGPLTVRMEPFSMLAGWWGAKIIVCSQEPSLQNSFVSHMSRVRHDLGRELGNWSHKDASSWPKDGDLKAQSGWGIWPSDKTQEILCCRLRSLW